MKITPGKGIENIKFGMSDVEVIATLGPPDFIDNLEHVEGSGDYYREIYYTKLGCSFSFNQEDDYRLGCISVTGRVHLLFNNNFIGLNVVEAKKTISSHTSEVPVYEDCTWGKDESSELISIDNLGIMFWFKSGVLEEIIISCLFKEDNETIIWP